MTIPDCIIDTPAQWISEETISAPELDAAPTNFAAARAAFRRAIRRYAEAVWEIEPRFLASDPDAWHVQDITTDQVRRDRMPLESPVPESVRPYVECHAPETIAIAIANGPGVTLALIYRARRIAVVDVGNSADAHGGFA
jgi:hypothetical protein